MIIDLKQTAVGKGIYAPREASRLTGVSTRRIKGWLKGYARHSQPVVVADFIDDDEMLQLSFADLMEVRIVNGFLRRGISWKELRRAAKSAASILNTTHPFVAKRFRTDGRKLFLELDDKCASRQLIALAESQHMFHSFIDPYLRDVEYRGDDPIRWRPLGNKRLVILDATRSFGRPIGEVSGVPTEILASLAESTSVREVSDWYEVSPKEVRHALVFEQSIAA